jgi:hypothetical protein
VGAIPVALDGSKVLASASKHAAISYGRAGEQLQQLELEIAQLLAKAEAADAVPLEDGLSIPAEIERRVQRKAKLAQARAEMEARARARAAAEQPEYERKMAAREAQRQAGKKPRGHQPQPPPSAPAPKDQFNFSDPESRIMKAGTGDHFEQAYNAQAAVEVASRLIVGQRVCTAPNDQEQLAPTLAAVAPAAGPVARVLIDHGFLSEAAVRAVEQDAAGRPTGVEVLAAMGRERHGRAIADLEQRADPEPPGPEASFEEKMRHRVATKAGRACYKLRQQTVEPVFGIIKAAMGFRRFSLRGLAKVSLEWTLVSLAYNVRRLHRLGATLASA